MDPKAKVNIKTTKLANGVDIPWLGLGTSRTTQDSANFYNCLKFALKVGYRMFDTAWVYFNDAIFNRVLSESLSQFDVEIKREDLFLICKLWNTFHSKEMVKIAVADTLKNIGINYIDLYLIHWPMGFKENVGTNPYPQDEQGNLVFSDVHFLETYKAMEEFVKNGTIKSIGVCNFNISQLQEILNNCEIKPSVNQIEVHPYLQNDKLVEFCQNNGIAVMAYGTLGSYDLTETKENLPQVLEDETIIRIAQKYNKTPAQICLRWCLQRGCLVIPRSLEPDRIVENAQVFDFEIENEDMMEIKKLNKNLRIYSVPEQRNHKFYPFYED